MPSFDSTFSRKARKSWKDNQEEFKQNWNTFFDLNLESKYYNFDINSYLVKPENYKKLLKLFNIENENISLLHLQNVINKFFEEINNILVNIKKQLLLIYLKL